MFKWMESRVFWGLILIGGGLLFLLQNLGLFAFGELFWALLLGLGGLFFLSIFFQSRENWWALIPGMTLVSIATLIALDTLFPRLGDIFGGAIVLGGIGTAFLLIFLMARENWWAVIPAGVMLTLASITVLDNLLPGRETGGFFFLGLAATFALVALLPTRDGPQRWAWIPATALGLMGVFLTMNVMRWMAFVWPLVLIAGGAILVLRSLAPRAE